MNLEYTLWSIAFGSSRFSSSPTERDYLSVSEADVGGEVGFSFHDLSDSAPRYSVKVSSFGDSLNVLLSEPIQGILRSWRAAGGDDSLEANSPSFFINLLEACGAKPSRYHQQGLKKEPADLSSTLTELRLVKSLLFNLWACESDAERRTISARVAKFFDESNQIG